MRSLTPFSTAPSRRVLAGGLAALALVGSAAGAVTTAHAASGHLAARRAAASREAARAIRTDGHATVYIVAERRDHTDPHIIARRTVATVTLTEPRRR